MLKAMAVFLAAALTMVGAGMLAAGVCMAFHNVEASAIAGVGAFLLAGGILGLREHERKSDNDGSGQK